MEKLTLEHMAAYLPYRLKVERISFKNERYKELTAYDLCPDGEIENIRPILRPLCDLYEDCINGKNPLSVLKDIYNSIGENETPITELEFHNIGSFTLFGLMTSDSFEVSVPIWMYQKLISWHFDVFGLIDKGLAVSIHDIKR